LSLSIARLPRTGSLSTDRSTRRPWSPAASHIWIAAGPALFLGVFFLLPLMRVVARSFLEPHFGFGNFIRLLTGGPYLTVLSGTLQTACVVTLVCLLLAYPLAFIGSRLQGRAYTLYMGMLLIPLWTSVVIRSYAWMVLFQRNGPINQFLQFVGLTGEPIRMLQTSFAVDVGMVHILLPFMVLPILTTMRNLDQTLLRAGEILGASPARLFLRVFVPLTLPGASAGVILVFISALGFFITPALLGGGRNTMIAVLIEQQAVDLLNWPLASALATVLLVIAITIYAGYSRATRRFNEARSG
jgi:putative spermidine/putrescine transport system permease protein/mannopine transport system permease protein